MKPDLFLEDAVSTQSIADELNVSLASVRNWVISGELKSVKRGYVSKNSFMQFKDEVVGKTRLVKRANKQYIDDIDHFNLRLEVLESISARQISLDEVSFTYEERLGKAHRNQEGVYYTPDDIVDKMFARLEGDVSNLYFLDPCCGSGNFLLGALRRGFKPKNIYGSDCDETALEIAKARVENKIGSSFLNLKCGDFLHEAGLTDTHSNKLFDVIFTNPPWGKKYSKEMKCRLAEQFNNGFPVDSSALFTLAALRLCRSNAKIGMLLPDSFCNISAFKTLRKRLLGFSIQSIENHQRPFKGLLVGAVSIIFEKANPKENATIQCISNAKQHLRSLASFTKNPNYIFNFAVDQNGANLIEYLYSIESIRLTKDVKWGLGVVTGNNKKFCHTEISPSTEAIYTGADIVSIDDLKPAKRFISPRFEQYQQVAPEKMYRAKEKLIYKFISNKLCFFYDDEQRLILNSANMLITAKGFPISMRQLAFLLNSDIMNFVFRSIFNTHKILRSDLESLPIFASFFESDYELTEASLLEFLNLEESHGTYRIKK